MSSPIGSSLTGAGLISHRFRDLAGISEVLLPFALDDLCAAYDALTARMARLSAPEAFSRDEWGYLLTFMRGRALRDVFTKSFGPVAELTRDAADADQSVLPARLIRPRAEIAIWLPNNVSLLGPLTVILALATGARVRAKAGSGSKNLTTVLRDYILAADPGPLLNSLWQTQLITKSFDRHDPRNADWSKTADARIFFGGDAAAAAVEALPHKVGAPYFAFGDHSSLVWADAAAVQDEAVLMTLWRVFQVYGKAGCTSPQRLVLIGGTEAQAVTLAKRLKAMVDASPSLPPPVHIASDSVMAEQVARAQGWQTERTARGEAVFMAGGSAGQDLPGLMGLQILALPQEAALAALPANTQTVGYIAPQQQVAKWMRALVGSSALRLVPVHAMHHFGPFWDGQAFWRGLFQETEIR